MEEAPECSPEELAKQLFSKSPGNPCSVGILPYSASHDNDATSFNFEILLTIYLEGFMNILDVKKQCSASPNPGREYEVENEIYKTVSLEDLRFPEPWFQSFGYTIEVTEYKNDKQGKREFKNMVRPGSYCRILLGFDPRDRLHFLMKGLTTRYHFILNGGFRPTDRIEDMYATLDKGDYFYRISFREFRSATIQTS